MDIPTRLPTIPHHYSSTHIKDYATKLCWRHTPTRLHTKYRLARQKPNIHNSCMATSCMGNSGPPCCTRAAVSDQGPGCALMCSSHPGQPHCCWVPRGSMRSTRSWANTQQSQGVCKQSEKEIKA